MIALDTNVLVRLIARDDPGQLAAAETLLNSDAVIVPLIALVETAWVLRSSHGYSDRDVATALSALLALDGVTVEHGAAVAWALERFRLGADLADMLLLVEARQAAAFATFDRRLVRRAGDAPPVPVRLL